MTLTAPYNFVPLSRHVCQAKDLDQALAGVPSQDMPIEGGLSGSLTLTLTCDGPLLVNWRPQAQKTDPKTMGRVPIPMEKDVPAIPGSTLRGMVRNVLEIATFGKMALVDDQRTSMRDLNAVLDYRRHFTATLNRDHYASKVNAGWLRIVGGAVTLTPCEYARVDHWDTLDAMSLRNV